MSWSELGPNDVPCWLDIKDGVSNGDLHWRDCNPPNPALHDDGHVLLTAEVEAVIATDITVDPDWDWPTRGMIEAGASYPLCEEKPENLSVTPSPPSTPCPASNFLSWDNPVDADPSWNVRIYFCAGDCGGCTPSLIDTVTIGTIGGSQTYTHATDQRGCYQLAYDDGAGTVGNRTPEADGGSAPQCTEPS